MKNFRFELSVENEISTFSGSLPLPTPEIVPIGQKTHVSLPFGGKDIRDPETRRKAIESKRANFDKEDYLHAVRTHCQACHGYGDCEAGPMLDEDNSSDGCHLYVLTRQYPKRGLRMAAVRKIVKAHCVDCVGLYKEKLDETLCQSPECSMYRVRFGRKKRPVMDEDGPKC